MKFIVKLPAEITIKSRPVRKRFTKILDTNIKNVLSRIDAGISTSMNWDNIDVNASDNSLQNRQRLIDALKCIPGIPIFLEAQQTKLVDIQDILDKTLKAHIKTIENAAAMVDITVATISTNNVEEIITEGTEENAAASIDTSVTAPATMFPSNTRKVGPNAMDPPVPISAATPCLTGVKGASLLKETFDISRLSTSILSSKFKQ